MTPPARQPPTVNNRVIVVDQKDVIFLTTPAHNGRTCVYVTLTLDGKLSFEGGQSICDTLDPHPAPHTSPPAPNCKKCYDDGYSAGIREAAKAAREQVLGLIEKWIKEDVCPPGKKKGKRCVKGCAMCFVESLRAQQQEGVSEG